MKLQKFFLSLFRVDDTLESYKYPAIKMIFSASLASIMLYITLNTNIENRILGNTVSSFSSILLLLCVQCFIIAWSELGYVRDNKEKKNTSFQEYNNIAIDIQIEKIFSMVKKEDIMSFDILFNGKIINIGTSSDSTNSKIFDKRYYINDFEFENFEEFKLNLIKYSTNDMILVARIDEVPAKKYFK